MKAMAAYLESDPDAVSRLATKLDVHISTIYRWAKGTKPHRRFQKQIEKATSGAVPASSWTKGRKS